MKAVYRTLIFLGNRLDDLAEWVQEVSARVDSFNDRLGYRPPTASESRRRA